MRTKNIYLTAGIIAVLVLILIILQANKEVLVENKAEEKEENQTNVSDSVPAYIALQQRALYEAVQLYQRKKAEGMNFSSQCLGVVAEENYVVDIVHVPRIAEDNLPENQCLEFLRGQVKHFIELDKNGNIIRVV